MRQMLRCQPYCVGAEVVSAVISCYLNLTVCKAERSASDLTPNLEKFVCIYSELNTIFTILDRYVQISFHSGQCTGEDFQNRS